MSADALSIADSAWLLTGNAGTNNNVHFLGTKDSVTLTIRVNNVRSGWIDFAPTYNTAWGFRSGQLLAQGFFGSFRNTAIGSHALASAEHTAGNTAIGAFSMQYTTTGSGNTGVGVGTLQYNESGYSNTAIGADAMALNRSGGGNTAVGALALQENNTGAENTVAGSSALRFNKTGNYNVAIDNAPVVLL